METKTTVSEESKKDDTAIPIRVPTSTAHTAPTATAEVAQPAEVPDPDEDDLDDLDDMLQDFATVKVEGRAEQLNQSTSAASPESLPNPIHTSTQNPAASGEPEMTEEEFAKQLQAGMADLLDELEKSPNMQEQFEDMFKQMAVVAEESGQTGTTAADSSSAKTNPPGNSDASFQETIRRTMERMQASGEQATAAAATGSGDDFMSELMKQMGSGDIGGEGGEEEFSKMLMGMMEQLTNKEILYEPMKELDDKFPEWFENNKASTSAEDLKRYEEQRALVREIVAKFEETSYSDGNAADREYIVDRMQKMQAAGSPPSDLVGDMASAQEAFGGADDQCNPQ